MRPRLTLTACGGCVCADEHCNAVKGIAFVKISSVGCPVETRGLTFVCGHSRIVLAWPNVPVFVLNSFCYGVSV